MAFWKTAGRIGLAGLTGGASEAVGAIAGKDPMDILGDAANDVGDAISGAVTPEKAKVPSPGMVGLAQGDYADTSNEQFRNSVPNFGELNEQTWSEDPAVRDAAWQQLDDAWKNYTQNQGAIAMGQGKRSVQNYRPGEGMSGPMQELAARGTARGDAAQQRFGEFSEKAQGYADRGAAWGRQGFNFGKDARDYGVGVGGRLEQQGQNAFDAAGLGVNRSERARRQLMDTAGTLEGLEATEGPSAAQAQLQSGLNRAQQSNLMLARSGGFGGGASRTADALRQNASMGQGAAADAAQLRAQENAAWRQRRANTLAGAGGLYGQASNLGLGQSNIGLGANQQAIGATTAGGQIGLAGHGYGMKGVEQGMAGDRLGIEGTNTAAGIYGTGVNAGFAGDNQNLQAINTDQAAKQAYEGMLTNEMGIKGNVAVQNANSANAMKGAIIGGVADIAGSAIGGAKGSDERNKIKLSSPHYGNPYGRRGAPGIGIASDERNKSKVPDYRDVENSPYMYKDTSLPGTNEEVNFGPMAQDLRRADPEQVFEGPRGMLMVDPARNEMANSAAIGDLQSRFDALEKKLGGRSKRVENTELSPAEESEFRQWAKENNITDVDHPESFYDYRGFWKDTGGQPIRGGVDHFPDTYKQHGHPTFSVESKYSEGPFDGGRWLGDDFMDMSPQREAFSGPSATERAYGIASDERNKSKGSHSSPKKEAAQAGRDPFGDDPFGPITAEDFARIEQRAIGDAATEQKRQSGDVFDYYDAGPNETERSRIAPAKKARKREKNEELQAFARPLVTSALDTAALPVTGTARALRSIGIKNDAVDTVADLSANEAYADAESLFRKEGVKKTRERHAAIAEDNPGITTAGREMGLLVGGAPMGAVLGKVAGASRAGAGIVADNMPLRAIGKSAAAQGLKEASEEPAGVLEDAYLRGKRASDRDVFSGAVKAGAEGAALAGASRGKSIMRPLRKGKRNS